MDEKALLTRFWTGESKTTRNVIVYGPSADEPWGAAEKCGLAGK